MLSTNNTPKETNITKYLYNGKLEIWTGEFRKVFSPIYSKQTSNPILLGSVPDMGQSQAMKLLASAENSYDKGRGVWAISALEERVKSIIKLKELLLSKKDKLVNLLMWEIAKTKQESAMEFDRTIVYLEDTITEAMRLVDTFGKPQIIGDIKMFSQKSPLGVVLCIGPYNYPLNETFCLLIPALLMGNSVIFKPAEQGILIMDSLMEIYNECFPKGVINVFFGKGENLAPALLKTGKVDVLALIGNSKTANKLNHLHPKPNRLKTILGLEAKNIAIISNDCDIDIALKEVLLGSLAFNGQRCTAIKLVFVHKDIVEEFNSKFSQLVDSLVIGMPWEEGVKITPLPQEKKPAYLLSLIEDAQKIGATIINKKGGNIDRTLVYPTVLYPVSADMRIYNEEQFGPIVPISPYNDEQEILDYLVDSDYGQQLSLFTNNINDKLDFVNMLRNQVCRININTKCQRGPDIFPFTGRKDSAVDSLSVGDSIRAFSIDSLVSVKL
ncbi:MAG: aldehyde dehydrogenase family protein [Flavobacteriaceae bacterium]|nr:aldehyde dehydrogenase family protein [Flavobacteriaceae bacterium]